jgi:hypothetical protein
MAAKERKEHKDLSLRALRSFAAIKVNISASRR